MTSILNPLAGYNQILKTPSQEDGIPDYLEEDLRAYGCKLIQQAGLLLKQNQVAMAAAQILFQRFWYVSSMKQFGVADVGMGALYLASKLEECPLRIRDLVNIYDLLLSRSKHTLQSLLTDSSPQPSTSTSTPPSFTYTPMSYFSPTFYDLKDAIVVSEMQILKRLGFHVSNTCCLPFGTLVNYLKVLELIDRPEGGVAERAWGYLNDALQTPVYCLFSMPTIVCASIILTTRQFSIPLPDKWWELFDAEWEDIWITCGLLMSLYRQKTTDQLVMRLAVSKAHVRKWLEENSTITT